MNQITKLTTDKEVKVVSTNIGKEKTIEWRGSEITTGIYKVPTTSGKITLGPYQVQDDYINNKKVHGGIDKATYGYGHNHYAYWKEKYPDLDWTYGMFGENLTLSDVDESQIKIGDIYKLGDAIVQISQPRQPCNKFAGKFQSTSLIKEFIEFDHPGIYMRVLQTGNVKVGDEMVLDLRNEKALTVQQIFQLLYSKKDKVNEDLAKEALYDSNLSKSNKEEIARHWKLT